MVASMSYYFFFIGHFFCIFSPLSLYSPHSGDCIKPLTLAFYPLSRSLAFILHFTGAFGRLQIFYLLQPRRDGISETLPKVCKDVPSHTEEEMWSEVTQEKTKVIRKKRFFFLSDLGFFVGCCCSVCSCHKPGISV